MRNESSAPGAGRSAQLGYRQARARRRRAAALSIGLSALSAVTVVAAVGRAAGRTEVWLVALGLSGAVLAWRIWPRGDPLRWLRGATGERATAVLLEGLPRRGWVVLHDRALSGSRANVDHLVVGRSGVWVVDTKTYRARLSVGRGRVWAGEFAVPTDGAAWEAEQVAARLDADVKAIVAVHGEGLRPRGKRCHGVLVVPADRLVRRVRRRGRPRRLTRAEVAELGRRASAVLPEY